MFVGHYGVALAAKSRAPHASLGVLIIAAQLVDLVWPVMLLLGIERVSIVPSDNPFLRLSFDSYPWTHSLVTTVLWGVLAGVAYGALRHDRAAGVVVGLLVVSPPPPSATAVAWASLSGWLIPLFGWWVDRHRTPTSQSA